MRIQRAGPGRLAVVVCLLAFGALLEMLASAEPAAGTTPPLRRPEGDAAASSLWPAGLALSGDAATQSNCTDPTVCGWLAALPPGSILLGVDPASADPADWDGGAGTLQLEPPQPLVRLVLTGTGWDGHGIRAYRPHAGTGASLLVDGVTVWRARADRWDGTCATPDGGSGCYWSLDPEPIRTTFVVTAPISHTLVLSVPAGAAWPLSALALAAAPMPTQLQGVAYGPHRYCEDPAASQPVTAEVEADLDLLAHISAGVRTYACGGVMGDFARRAAAHGLPVRIGAWLGTDPAANDAEAACAISVANESAVDGLVVGSEVLLRGDLTEAELVAYVQQVRAGAPPGTRIGYAEAWSTLFDAGDPGAGFYRHPDLVEAVDDVLVHVYGYWDQVPAGQAARYVVDRFTALRGRVQADYPGKRVLLGETGWPTQGDANGPAVPGVREQQSFLDEFLGLAEAQGLDFYYFAPFDGGWKTGEPNGVGPHWGFGTDGRNAKHGAWGVLLEPPAAHWARAYLPAVLRARPWPGTGTGVPAGPAAEHPPSAVELPFAVFADHSAAANHYFPSGWMGDTGDVGYDECWLDQVHDGETAVRLDYTPGGPQGWAGIYWQDPENNWGDVPGGYDLTGAGRLSFWARGEMGGELVEFGMGGLGWPSAPYKDSTPKQSITVTLTPQWRRYEVPLEGADLSHIAGGFLWVAGPWSGPGGITVYVDGVQYEE